MHRFVDNLSVGLALLASLIYAIVSLGPLALRQRLLAGTAAVLGHLPRFFGVRNLAERLRMAAGESPGACGGCDSCGAKPVPTDKASQDVAVPLSKIGRRG